VLSTPHRRHNPLTGEWVLVAAGRDARPWRGQVEPPVADAPLSYDPHCYLCPGNERAGGVRNPAYDGTFVFTNDYPALRPEAVEPGPGHGDALFVAEAQRGTCRVICFSPRHDATLSGMTAGEVRRVVDLWCDQHDELARDWGWVQVFENRGAAMGASNPHPHGQIWASATVPTVVGREDQAQRAHLADHGTALLAEYARRETDLGERIVVSNDGWAVIVPFWASWPYETLLVARGDVTRLGELTDDARTSLAEALQGLLAAYDGLFGVPFPYSMGWHPAPGRGPAPHWVLHAHFYPPLRRADARKFLVGYELLAEPQRDLTPEEAAQRLRAAAGNA
jgi:UDPglucose--hexose-1-phosphate uridylyltransferase